MDTSQRNRKRASEMKNHDIHSRFQEIEKRLDALEANPPAETALDAKQQRLLLLAAVANELAAVANERAVRSSAKGKRK